MYLDITEDEKKRGCDWGKAVAMYEVDSPQQCEAITYTKQRDGTYLIRVPEEMKYQGEEDGLKGLSVRVDRESTAGVY